MTIPTRTLTDSPTSHLNDSNLIHGRYNKTLVERGFRYVAQDGSDSNDGLTWETAMASPQAAYDDLVAYANANFTLINGRTHVGTVTIGRGLYNVGTRLALLKSHSCEFRGAVMTRAQDDFDSMARLTTTSPAATEIIALTDDITTINGYGFKFINLGFTADITVATSLTAMIRTNDVNFSDVKDCYAQLAGGTMAGYFLVIDSNSDTSWWTIENNRVHDMGFLWSVGTDFNQNRWWVAHNQSFGTRTGSGMAGVAALFNFKRLNHSTVINNNLEAANIGIRVEGGVNNVFIGNAGECDSYTNPLYFFTGAIGHTIYGGHCTVSGAGTSQIGVFAEVGGTSRDILIVHPDLKIYGFDTATSVKDRILDSTDVGGQANVLTSRGFKLSTSALDLPWLGAAPGTALITLYGTVWYDEVNDRIFTRAANSGTPAIKPILTRDREVARGTSTILDTTSTLVVAHGMPATPTAVVVTPNGNETIWVTSIGGTNFTLNRAGTSGARIVTWMAFR